MTKYTHVHQYYLTRMGQKKTWKVYKCAMAGCPHFLPDYKMAYGRQSVCWECGDIFIITRIHRGVVRPKCCKGGRPKADRDTIKDMMERLQTIGGDRE